MAEIDQNTVKPTQVWRGTAVYSLNKRASYQDRKALYVLARSNLKDLVDDWLAALPATVKTQALNRCEGGIGGDCNYTCRQFRFSHNSCSSFRYPKILVYLREPAHSAKRLDSSDLPWQVCADALLGVFEERVRVLGATSSPCLVMRIRLPRK